MKNIDFRKIKTLGQLKAAGYRTRSIKEELRENLIASLQQRKQIFAGIIGYDHSVIPDLQTAILSRHNIILLGLRGQAKTRLARQTVELLDEWMPIVAGSELNDDPLAPISWYAREMIAKQDDETPIEWVHRNDRYTEKLATPDVSVADLIGDVDPIKAAALKLPYSDERVLHFGLIPRSHRSIFVINELPDLQPRIQVALFNILQEKDLQIRGFKLRLPLDVEFVFTANPEDYTNRGLIVTPLKDRIESQILTHYPKTIQVSRQITEQEAELTENQQQRIQVHDMVRNLIEQIAFEARASEYIDAKSGVSARLTISAFENIVSTAERRMLLNAEKSTWVRITDFVGAVPAITGKIELVYEGDQQGPAKIAHTLIGKAIRSQFAAYFPGVEKLKRDHTKNPYYPIINWFGEDKNVDLLNHLSNSEYERALNSVPGLKTLVSRFYPDLEESAKFLFMEFVLHGLAEYSFLSKLPLESGTQFKDLLTSMFAFAAEEPRRKRDDLETELFNS